jgi:hypothetical protein
MMQYSYRGRHKAEPKKNGLGVIFIIDIVAYQKDIPDQEGQVSIISVLKC